MKVVRPFTLEIAIHMALVAHERQRDMSRQPYILHPLRVMMKQTSITAMMAAVLHDAVEDSNGEVTIASLREAGCPEEVVEAIELLTHPKGMTDEEYLESIKKVKLNQIATAVKLADLEDNMDIKRIRGRREGLNEKDLKRLQKYLNAWTILKGE